MQASEDSSDSSSDNQNLIQVNLNFNPNDSHNQTAASIDEKLNEMQVEDQNSYAEDALQEFYQKYLKIDVDLRFDSLQTDQDVFPKGIIGIYAPQPLVYFLPYTILVDSSQSLYNIRDKITQKYKKQQESSEIKINMYFDKNNQDELFISLHSVGQLIHYKIRRVSVQKQYHQYIDCLDSDILVDRLFNFYKITYKKFFFEEISVFFMYWAYVKKFLNQDFISPSAIKMLIICLFINFGYGVENILTTFQKKFWDRQKKCIQMSKTSRKGQCSIDKDILKYQNYSIQYKKGLYIVSQKKYQIIPLIQPIFYPIGKRKQGAQYIFEYREDEKQYFQKQAKISFTRLNRRKVSRYHLLFLLMKNMDKYFNYPNKLIFDMKRERGIFQESSNQFLLEIQHPVFNQVISKALVQNGSAPRRIRSELKQLMTKMKQSQEAIQNVIYLFVKK